jgi:hypothetical protein
VGFGSSTDGDPEAADREQEWRMGGGGASCAATTKAVDVGQHSVGI